MLEWRKELQIFQLLQDNLQIRDKLENRGGSPPILGLKEATPELGEIRLNRDTFKNITIAKTNMNTIV